MPTQNPYTPPSSSLSDTQSKTSPRIGAWAGASLFWRLLVLQLIVAVPVALLIPVSVEFIRLKPSAIYLAMALVLSISAFFSKSGILIHVWGRRLGWEPTCWRRANWIFAACYIAMAIGNVVLIFTTSIEAWIQIKFYVPIFLLIAACLAAPRFMRNAI